MNVWTQIRQGMEVLRYWRHDSKSWPDTKTENGPSGRDEQLKTE